MCGIVGVAGNTMLKDKKIFREMLIFDQIRGYDSTGVVGVSAHTLEFDKDVGTPYDLWGYGQSHMFDMKGLTKKLYHTMIGHNRAATVGSVTRRNAHPFDFSNIIGVHNGSLRDTDDLIDNKKFAVDSESMFNTINAVGIQKAWSMFNGAASIVWWDREEGTLNFARNGERPMYFAHSKNKDKLYFASEPWMITAACFRHDQDLFVQQLTTTDAKTKVKTTRSVSTFATDVGYHYKFKVTGTSVELLSREKLPEQKPAPKKYSAGYWTGYSGSYSGPKGGTVIGKKNNVTNFERKKAEKMTHKKLLETTKGWAKNSDRMDKDMVGEKITLKFGITQSSIGPHPYFVGYLGDGKPNATTPRVEVYPASLKEFERIDEDLSGKREVVYTLTGRPRHRAQAGNRPEAIICSSQVLKKSSQVGSVKDPTFTELVEQMTDLVYEDEEPRDYLGNNGEYITRKEAEKQLQIAGNGCCWCSDWIGPEDLSHAHWVDANTIECQHCHNISQQYAVYDNM